MSGPSSENITGALTFYAYIAAALFLSGLICKDLVTEYFSRPREQRTQSGQVERKNGKKRDAHTQISTLAALSSISFAVLSYHMLSFLVDSFQVWACSNLLSTVSFLSIWNWSINSRLFRDFGEVICNQPRRFWWTQLTLAYSLGWNVYMTIEGKYQYLFSVWPSCLHRYARCPQSYSTSLDVLLPGSDLTSLFHTKPVSACHCPPERQTETPNTQDRHFECHLADRSCVGIFCCAGRRSRKRRNHMVFSNTLVHEGLVVRTIHPSPTTVAQLQSTSVCIIGSRPPT